MTVDGVAVDAIYFDPIKVDENHLEGLLRTASGAVFPGYDYFEFKPAVRCGDSSRHPDGVLLGEGEPRWWVVEVETHLHPVSEHIDPQLRDLAAGFYGPEAFQYLKRHPTFDASRYPVDQYKPEFLLVIDSVTPEIRDAASRWNFTVVECSVFRSSENRYALTVTGPRPRRMPTTHVAGLEVVLKEEGDVALLVPADGRKMPEMKTTDILVNGMVYDSYRLRDRRGIALPVSGAALRAEMTSDRFRLTPDGVLIALVQEKLTVTV